MQTSRKALISDLYAPHPEFVGGKDSSALAVYMKDRVPEMEYVSVTRQGAA